MERRPLGTTGLEVSPIALGCGAMGGDEHWGVVDDSESIAAIHCAIEGGVNLLDTAPTQGDGHSETIVGRAIQGRREQVLISTKCGLVPDARSPGGYTRCLRRESILRECENSLRRMRIETIDLYQCHWPDPETPIAETLGALESLVEQGKVRAIGLSNYGCQRLSEARAAGRVDFVQTGLSVLDRRAAEEIIPYCQEYRVSVLAYGCLLRGLLTGKFDAQSRFTGLRAADPAFSGERYRRNLHAVEKLQAIAENYGRSVAQLALNWVTSYPGVTSAVVGAKRASQILENLGGWGWRIGDEDLRKIDELMAA